MCIFMMPQYERTFKREEVLLPPMSGDYPVSQNATMQYIDYLKHYMTRHPADPQTQRIRETLQCITPPYNQENVNLINALYESVQTPPHSKKKEGENSSQPFSKRDFNLEKTLGAVFLDVCNKQQPLSSLQRNSEAIRSQIAQKDKQGWDDRFSYLLLKDALDEIETLHDEFTRAHYEQHPEELRSYAQKLLGLKEATYSIVLPNKIKVDITYLLE